MKSVDQFEQERSEWGSKGYSILRVIAEHKGRYIVADSGQEMSAEITGKMMFDAETRKDYPAVGDWVAAQSFDEHSPAIIHHILPRSTTLSRKTSGREVEEQIIAVNVDVVFIVQSLDAGFNLRRLERFIVIAVQSGAQPVILLSKADLLSESELGEKIEEVKKIAQNAVVVAYSAKSMLHLDTIRNLIEPHKTVCFIGSSGAGKSTLINRLIGTEKLHTQDVREEDAKGKHTTTHRELITLDNGCCVIDTPGLREIGLWETNGSIEETFPDIAELSLQCKFTDCKHAFEPGCAVQSALNDGTLGKERYESFLKLKKEADYIESKSSVTKQQERKAREKQMHKDLYARLKMKKRK